MSHEDGDLAETLPSDRGDALARFVAETRFAALGIVWHPDTSRIGTLAPIPFDRSGTAPLSRLTPLFAAAGESDLRPLLDRHLSRSPLLIRRLGDRDYLFTPPGNDVPVSINGKPLVEPMRVSTDALGCEIIICLSNRIVLSLFAAPARCEDAANGHANGLLGISAAINEVRRAIVRLAHGRLPVLIRGETGTGKELIAAGLHRAGDRSDRAMIPVNMATLTPALAAAELFGIKRGAFTGADRDKPGLFEQAEGGVLFLDEIGDTPNEVQPMLLRVIENGEFRRVGDDRLRRSDVRVFAATDRPLETNAIGYSFNQPLRRRLEAVSIAVPPLRFRRCDVGLLLNHFLNDASVGMPDPDIPNLPAAAVHRLALHAWPGNVRELQNLARQLRYGQPLSLEAYGASIASTSPPAAPVLSREGAGYEHPALISEAQLLRALDDNNWIVKATAKSLNLSRTSLYERMKASPAIRRIGDIPEDELRETLQTVPGGLDAWARHLRTTRESLARRLRGSA